MKEPCSAKLIPVDNVRHDNASSYVRLIQRLALCRTVGKRKTLPIVPPFWRPLRPYIFKHLLINLLPVVLRLLAQVLPVLAGINCLFLVKLPHSDSNSGVPLADPFLVKLP